LLTDSKKLGNKWKGKTGEGGNEDPGAGGIGELEIKKRGSGGREMTKGKVNWINRLNE
jgi:hypothetical protein